ncbi:MAG: hypothetical protein WCJ30_05725 [Deltaproteobacteria bacterium]
MSSLPRFCLLSLTALTPACASTVIPAAPEDAAADGPDAHVIQRCDGGIQWLDPVTDPPLPIAAEPAPQIAALTNGRFAVFQWHESQGALARFVPTSGTWNRDATLSAEWAGAPRPGDIVVQRLFVGELGNAPAFGIVANGAPGVVWTTRPSSTGPWSAATSLDPGIRGIGDLAFMDDHVTVSTWNLIIGMGAVSGLDMVTVDPVRGSILRRDVWETGSYAAYYTISDGPQLVRDGAGLFAVRPTALKVFSGPNTGVQLDASECCQMFSAAVGANHRVWVLHAHRESPRLRLAYVEGSSATPLAWSSNRVPLGVTFESAVAPAGDGAVIAYFEHRDLTVTLVDRTGAVRATASLPTHLSVDSIAPIRLAAASDGTFAVLWTAVDVAHAFANGAGGLVRFRLCGS